MNRTKQNSKEHVLVAWKDADVAELIRDKSFAGKLAPNPTNKENQPEGAKNESGTLKKKRMSKKMSIVPPPNDLAALGLSAVDKLDEGKDSAALKLSDQRQSLAKISNHFVFGNHGAGLATADPLINKTSNNKLDQSYKISYADMCQILQNYKSPLDESVQVVNDYFVKNYFPEWKRLMKFGFNILLHGVGSKKKLIQEFCFTQLSNDYYVELLGYHHDFNTKNLLKNILIDVLNLTETYKTADEQLNAINSNLKCPLYLIIHNIDGNCLRDTSIQYCLSELASNKFIHILASVDHINSSLLWDHMQYASFKWIHFETSTLVPYNDEIMFENSLMLNQTGNVQLSSMIHILKSLTQNAKNIFLIMVQYVLNPDNVKKSITFTKLYHECREKFFVSNELTLRAQLTEFIDHKLIKLKTESDGYETIYLLIDDKNLKLYLEDIKDKV